MKTATKTRTQRRMEKKQALLLLVLVLVVSLASFTLGVIVGQRGAARDLAQQQPAGQQVVKVPEPIAPPLPVKSTEARNEQPVAAAAQAETELTFYDNLAKESGAPLGSGINLPPQQEQPKPSSKPPIALPAEPIVQKTPVKLAAVTTVKKPVFVTGQPKVDPQGSYAVQVGSFGAAADAGKLKRRLLGRDYPVFLVEADLGAKGIWYRVRLGPYADRSSAESMQLLLEQQDKIKGFVSRQ